MTISLHLHDCRAKDPERAAISDAMSRYTGSITSPQPTRTAAATASAWQSADGRHNERNAARQKTKAADERQRVSVLALINALKETRVQQRAIAERLNVRPANISNIVNLKRQATDAEMDLIMQTIRDIDAENKAAKAPWQRRAEIIATIKANGITVASVARRAGVDSSYAGACLRSECEPSPQRRAMIETAFDAIMGEYSK